MNIAVCTALCLLLSLTSAGLFDHTLEQANLINQCFPFFFFLGCFFLSVQLWRISLESLVFKRTKIFQSAQCFCLKINLALRNSAGMIKLIKNAVPVKVKLGLDISDVSYPLVLLSNLHL